jgi:hypothetical protein
MIRALTLLLILQAGLIALLYWPDKAPVVPDSLLPAELVVSAIQIADGDSEVELRREASRWTVGGLPADADRVQRVLAALQREAGFAIARSASAAARFGVAEDDYERRIDIDSSQESIRLFLGTAPSFGKIHVRRDGDDAIHVLELNSVDVPATVSGWLDRSLLAEKSPTSIELYGTRFDLTTDGWQSAAGVIEGAAIDGLLQALATLQVSAVADPAVIASVVNDGTITGDNITESLRLSVNGNDLVLLHDPDADRYYLRSSRYEPVFDLSALDAQRLLDGARTLGESATPAT